MEGDKRHSSVFFWIVTTIRSNVCGGKCFDLDSELAQSSPLEDRALEIGGQEPATLRFPSEEGEFESDGTPLDLVGGESTGATHNDSRDHTRQLMFSNRAPSASVSEHFEKIDHIAIRLPAFEVSISCILPASRDSTGAFNRVGILVNGFWETLGSGEEEERQKLPGFRY
jgi:hypothetical protein